MFGYCTSLTTPDFSGWTFNLSGTILDWMFSDCANFNADITDWNVDNITSMYYMFGYASIFNQDLSGWNTSNVTNMFGMFCESEFSQDISKWNVSKPLY